MYNDLHNENRILKEDLKNKNEYINEINELIKNYNCDEEHAELSESTE
jgi:hypothetical protein